MFHALASYPETSTPSFPVSLNVYVPALKSSPLVTPPFPEIVVGPVAVNVQSVSLKPPPLLFLISLTNCSFGAKSSFVIVHTVD